MAIKETECWPTALGQSRCLTLCALLLAAGNTSAEYRFDVWTTESGLPNNTVNVALHSRQGYLWVGTPDGLARFDGVRFTVFNKVNSPGLISSRILALYEDSDGDLWIGTAGGGLIRYHQGRFTPVGPRNADIQSVSGDDRGNLWTFQQNALLRLQGSGFVTDLPDAAAFHSGKPLGWNRSGLVWATSEEALHIYVRGKLTTLYLSNGLPSLHITKVDEDQHGKWWLSTADAGLVKVEDGRIVKIYTERDGLPSNRLPSVFYQQTVACEDKKGNVWVHTGGPWLGRLKAGHFTAYPSSDTLSSQPLPTPGFVGSHIYVLLEDPEGNLWIGTDGSGLIRAREQVVNVLSTRHGLQAGNIYPICQDQAGAVWLGAWEKGLIRVEAGQVTNFPLEVPHNLVTALCADRQGNLWLGTYGGVVTFENGAITHAVVPSGLSNEVVSAILEDRAGAMWFGSEHGLFRNLNGELSRFTRRDGLGGETVSVLIEDHTGALWIGTRSGLTRLSEGRFTSWTEENGLPSNHLVSLYEDAEGTLWIGTSDGGLGRFKNGRFTRYTTHEGMFDNGVFQILEDAAGNLWLSSNRGIHRVNKRELSEFAEGHRRSITSIAYGKREGMITAECNGGRWPAGAKTRDGKLWFPTLDGVAVVDPAVVPTNPRAPPVIVEAVLVDRQPQALDRRLSIPPGKPEIEIQYTGLSFVNSDRLAFKYRLDGADSDWVEVGNRRAAYYSHLQPGRYTFTVLAANSDGVWNQTGASLPLIVLPAWYQTFLFRALAATIVCVVAVGLFHLRLRAVEWRRAAQEAFSRELIQQQEAERKRIAGELHDGLGQALLVIKNTASLASAPAAPAAEIRQDLAAIANLSGKALEDLRSISHALRPPELDRLGLTKALEHAVSLVADAAGLRFSAHLEPLDGLLAQEAEIHLYRLVQESLNNIVKHARASFVEVRAWSGEGYLQCSVRDNGEGFDPAGRQAGVGARHGLGLAGMMERVRLLGGQIIIHSQPGSGTLVEAKLPIQRKSI